jgi:hypothetical protein
MLERLQITDTIPSCCNFSDVPKTNTGIEYPINAKKHFVILLNKPKTTVHRCKLGEIFASTRLKRNPRTTPPIKATLLETIRNGISKSKKGASTDREEETSGVETVQLPNLPNTYESIVLIKLDRHISGTSSTTSAIAFFPILYIKSNTNENIAIGIKNNSTSFITTLSEYEKDLTWYGTYPPSQKEKTIHDSSRTICENPHKAGEDFLITYEKHQVWGHCSPSVGHESTLSQSRHRNQSQA